MKWLCQGLLVFLLIGCNEEAGTDKGKADGNKEAIKIRKEKVIRDVDQVDFDFNNDGMNDAIKQVVINKNGQNRVIHVFIKEPHGFVPTYDNDDNQMIYPGDSIAEISDSKFKFMYHTGDYFLFKFEQKDGQWIALQTE